ncbi:MAG TPA: CotH kinase family protein [Vicinamibacterales bacterium]|jgi:spore coat protein CotH
MSRVHLPAAAIAAALIGAASIVHAQKGPEPPVAPDTSAAFFDDSVLHEIRLNINSRDWASLRENYLENTYYPADFRWRDQVVRNIGIRSRGTGSRSGVKPGLRVDFDRYSTDQKFLGRLKSFVLRNNTQDASGMHERISMLFFRRMGAPAPREAHTRLFVNNAFAGLYTIVESVDKPFLERVNGENDGYLFKYDYNTTDKPWYFNDRGNDPRLYVPSPFKPETHEDDPHPEGIAELVQIVSRDSDAIFRRTVEPFIDFATFIRHIAVEIFLADVDGFNGAWGMNNFYLYRKDDRTPFQFIAWDKSEAFKGGADYQIGRFILDVGPPEQNRLTMRVLRDGELRNRLLNQLAECARVMSEIDGADPADSRNWMEREIDREYQQISSSVALSAEDRAYYSREQFEQEVERLRTFARDRARFMSDEIARWRRQ